jgi:hypothetical protein
MAVDGDCDSRDRSDILAFLSAEAPARVLRNFDRMGRRFRQSTFDSCVVVAFHSQWRPAACIFQSVRRWVRRSTRIFGFCDTC